MEVHQWWLGRLCGMRGSGSRHAQLVPVYRRSCDVCARHLETLALEGLPDGRPIVLVRVPEVDESVDSAVEMLPTAALEVDLHHLSKGYGVTTPWSFDVSAEFLVENVTDLGEH